MFAPKSKNQDPQDQQDPLFNVTLSPYKIERPKIFKQFVIAAPKWAFAYYVYLDICLLYYLMYKTRGVAVYFILGFGLYGPDEYFISRVLCMLLMGYCISGLVFLRIFLSYQANLRWIYDYIGEERVKSKLF